MSAAIRSARLPPGTVLPSSRALASELAVARGTISLVYDELVGEGLIEVRSRSLTVVAGPPRARAGDIGHGPADDTQEEAPETGDGEPAPFPAFLPGIPAFDIFPPPAGRGSSRSVLTRCSRRWRTTTSTWAATSR